MGEMQAAPRTTSADVYLDESWQMVGIVDLDGRFIYAGEAARALFCVEPVSLIGTNASELLSAVDRMRWLTALADSARDRTPTRRRLAARDGTERSRALEWRLSSLRGASDSVVITLEVRAERGPRSSAIAARSQDGDELDTKTALSQKSAELEAILRALPDLFFRFDAQGRFLDFAAPANSPLYAPPACFLGKRPHEVMPPALADAMERTRAETHDRGALVTLEYDIEIEGKRQHYEARYVPHVDGETIALVRDLTDRIEAEAKLRTSDARFRESQKLDAVGRLAGGVAHDFNNLLMIILGYTAAIARHITPTHPAAQALDEIGRAVDRATALTKQLLALSRRQPVQPTILDLGAILNDMGSMLERVLGEHIVFSLDVAPGLARLNADRSQLEQVVLNLVLNARDAMPRGGRLSIRARNERAGGEGAASAAGDDDLIVALSVSDTGEGMDEDTRRRIFDPFFTTKPRGTGLGLFTVQHIVDEYGGTITVHSRLEHGTEIVVRLPAVDQPATPFPAEQRGALVGGSETVLVVEDEEPVRTLLVDVLDHLGYRVLAACNAQEALERVHANEGPIHVLLTDVVMPGRTGWELAAKVVAARPGCRVLYMSGHAIAGDDSSSMRPEHGELLRKPFTPGALATRLRELLAGS